MIKKQNLKRRAAGDAQKSDPDGKKFPTSFRPSPKTKEALQYLCRLSGRTVREVLDRLIMDAAKKAIIGHGSSERNFFDLWDPHAGVYMLNLISHENTLTNAEEDEVLRFTQSYWEFFYERLEHGRIVSRDKVVALWDSLSHFRALSLADFEGAGHAMAAELKKKGITPPVWPRKGMDGKQVYSRGDQKSDTREVDVGTGRRGPAVTNW